MIYFIWLLGSMFILENRKLTYSEYVFANIHQMFLLFIRNRVKCFHVLVVTFTHFFSEYLSEWVVYVNEFALLLRLSKRVSWVWFRYSPIRMRLNVYTN